METTDFGRLITAMVTPLDEQGQIEKKNVALLVEHLIQTGTDTIVVAGTTGESPTLSSNEKIELFHLVKQTAGDRVKIIANVGSNDTIQTIRFAKKVEEFCGVDGFLLVNPYYNKPSQEGLYQHFKTVADNVTLPIMLYNIPGRTGVNLTSETTVRLSKIDNIVAIKESSGNLDQMAAIIEGTDENFRLYSGDDNLTLPIMAVGGYGVVSVASHFFGNAIKQMVIEKDATIHRKLLPFMQTLFIDTNPIATKYLLSSFGMMKPKMRLPLVPTTEENEQKIISSYKETVAKLQTVGVTL